MGGKPRMKPEPGPTLFIGEESIIKTTPMIGITRDRREPTRHDFPLLDAALKRDPDLQKGLNLAWDALKEAIEGVIPHDQRDEIWTDLDDYPDIELFQTAGMLARHYKPDYLLVHPLGMDYMGEKHGADSAEYRNQAILQDVYMSALIGEWLQTGYTVLVTSDHGMNADKLHGGTTPEVREVPLYLMRPGIPGAGDTSEVVSQLQIAPTVLNLLDLEIPDTMQHPAIV